MCAGSSYSPFGPGSNRTRCSMTPKLHTQHQRLFIFRHFKVNFKVQLIVLYKIERINQFSYTHRIIHYIDVHLRMQYKCTRQNITDKPVQRGIFQFLIRLNRNRLVPDSLPSVLNWFIRNVLQSTIVLHPKVNIYFIGGFL